LPDLRATKIKLFINRNDTVYYYCVKNCGRRLPRKFGSVLWVGNFKEKAEGNVV